MPAWLFSPFSDRSVYLSPAPIWVQVAVIGLILWLYWRFTPRAEIKAAVICAVGYWIQETPWNAAWEFGWDFSTFSQWDLMIRPSTGMQFVMNVIMIPWMVRAARWPANGSGWMFTLVNFPLVFWLTEIIQTHLGLFLWNVRPYHAYSGDFAFIHGAINLPMYPFAVLLGVIAWKLWDPLVQRLR